jgi:hypothetical protein
MRCAKSIANFTRLLIAVSVGAFLFGALAHATAGTGTRTGSQSIASAEARPRLPEWAPKHPSREFVRASKVLKPLPLDTLKDPMVGEAENAAKLKAATSILFPAAWELFGTLTDDQVRRFLTSRHVQKVGNRTTEYKVFAIPFRSLAPAQQHAFDNWVKAFDKARWAGKEGYLAGLRRMGAKRDLSNVQVGFLSSRRMVHVYVCIDHGNRGNTSLLTLVAILRDEWCSGPA